MNITASSVNCTQVGDGWSAVETTANLNLPNGGWAVLAPNTPIAGQVAVKMWLKGVTIVGAVQATDANSPAYPELPGPASGYRMGLIQIIKKTPIMVARYEGYKYRRWLQRTIPFFDSSGVDASPWYLLGTRADLTAGVNRQVTLEDYPVTMADVRFDTPASGRIEDLQKALDFDVFLAVAPKSAFYKQSGIRILWHLTWSSETHVVFTWNPAGQLSYTAPVFKRSATAPTQADAAASKNYVQGFPLSAQGANESISSADLL